MLEDSLDHGRGVRKAIWTRLPPQGMEGKGFAVAASEDTIGNEAVETDGGRRRSLEAEMIR